jgi:hypothetical protein
MAGILILSSATMFYDPSIVPSEGEFSFKAT